jgi:Leucine-rich repeat (LRR) protein
MQIIPSVLSVMPQLKILKTGGYKINNPVVFLNSLRGTNVTSLDLSNCGLNYVPSQISYFTKLKEINLSNNNIYGLGDALFGLPSLNAINLSGNHLKDLPASINQAMALKELNVSNNAITTLPATFGNLKLNKLNIEGNNLDAASLNILNMMNGVAPSVPNPDPLMPRAVKHYKQKSAHKHYKKRKK